MTKYERDDNGFLKGVDYKLSEDGSVDWRAMVKEDHLYANKEWFERRSKAIPTSIEGLKDHQLLIKLSGIKELAKLRGFRSVLYPVLESREGFAVAKCSILWIRNAENPYEVTFEDVANAALFNTSGFGAKFLEPIAANRAFVRCVRNFLNVHIVGADEIDASGGAPIPNQKASDHNPNKHGPVETLKKHLQIGDGDFDSFLSILNGLKKKKVYDFDFSKWSSWDDLPVSEAAKLIKVLKAS